MKNITLILQGQCTSGKNSIITTRTGLRFPSKRFTSWRADAIRQLTPQLLEHKFLPFVGPVDVEIEYTCKDKIRRDVPGIIDALWHVLEKVGIITDDTFLGGHGKSLHFVNKGVDKEKVGVIITIKQGENNE